MNKRRNDAAKVGWGTEGVWGVAKRKATGATMRVQSVSTCVRVLSSKSGSNRSGGMPVDVEPTSGRVAGEG